MIKFSCKIINTLPFSHIRAILRLNFSNFCDVTISFSINDVRTTKFRFRTVAIIMSLRSYFSMNKWYLWYSVHIANSKFLIFFEIIQTYLQWNTKLRTNVQIDKKFWSSMDRACKLDLQSQLKTFKICKYSRNIKDMKIINSTQNVTLIKNLHCDTYLRVYCKHNNRKHLPPSQFHYDGHIHI